MRHGYHGLSWNPILHLVYESVWNCAHSVDILFCILYTPQAPERCPLSGASSRSPALFLPAEQGTYTATFDTGPGMRPMPGLYFSCSSDLVPSKKTSLLHRLIQHLSLGICGKQ